MDTLSQWVTLGKQAFENKDYHKAERYLRQVLGKNKNYADVYHMLGVIHHVEGKFESAIECFERALKINPHYTEALLNLSVLYNDLGRYQDAKKLYGQLHKRTDGSAQPVEPVLRGKLSNLHAQVGDIYSSIGMYRYAVEEYKKGLELNPDYADIRTKLGVALREEGRLGESVKELKLATTQNSHYMIAHIQLGVTCYSLKKFTEAKKQWQFVLKQDPENESAKMYLRLCGKPMTP